MFFKSKIGLLVSSLFCFLVLFACNHKPAHEKHNLPKTESKTDTTTKIQVSDTSVQVKTMFTDNIGWGYEISFHGKPYIRQEHIPAINGIHGFKTESDAIKAANLVASKIVKNTLPPSVTAEELKALHIDLNF